MNLQFAVDALTTASRHDLVAFSNVRVTAISPGAVRTEFSNVRFGGNAAKVIPTSALRSLAAATCIPCDSPCALSSATCASAATPPR